MKRIGVARVSPEDLAVKLFRFNIVTAPVRIRSQPQ
jgi:hypothetical protein